MKRYQLFFLPFILFYSIGFGQTNTYHPFPESVIWRVDYKFHFPVQYICTKYYYFEYHSTGDTAINSRLYRKIFVNEMQDTITCTVGGPYFLPIPGYVGALRDDSLARKTFFVFPNSTIDSLLYDYNMTVGDTIKGIIAEYFNQIDTNRTVISVDSVLISTQYHKRWNFSQNEYGDSVYMIEGIGTSSGLLEPLYPWVTEFTKRHLICAKDSFQTYFISNHYSVIGCNLFVPVKNELNLRNSISIYPNPFSNETTLKADQEIKNSTILIIDSFGKHVKQINNITGREIKLHLDNLSGGIYFLLLIQEDGTITTLKLIII
jgi:hypothetical protein